MLKLIVKVEIEVTVTVLQLSLAGSLITVVVLVGLLIIQKMNCFSKQFGKIC